MRSLIKALTTASAILLLLLAALACNPLPKGWPIAELTPPKGATMQAVPNEARPTRERLNAITEIEHLNINIPPYEIAFDYKAGWEAVSSDIESKIGPLGYKRWEPKDLAKADALAEGYTGQKKLSDVIRFWVSDNSNYVVALLNTVGFSGEGDIDSQGDYTVSIAEIRAKK